MPHDFELRLFGVPEILHSDGVPRRLRARKQLSLLVYLSLEGRDQPVARDLLAEMLWEGVSLRRARHSLEQAVSAIRGLFGPRAVTRVGGGIRLSVALATDLDLLGDQPEQLDVAHPLAQLDESAGAEFAHWVERARARCLRLAEQALRDNMARHRRNGELDRVHRCAQVLYEIDALSDLAVHALAERELLRGDVIAAIRLLRDHIARVQEALGCMPQKDTERLLRRLEAGAYPPVELIPPRMASGAATLRPAVFVGRERELAQLEAEWESARAGGFQACLVEGRGGVGKSSLVRRFAATLAARAQPVFLVTCQEIGEGIPFAAISDVVTALARDPAASGTDPKWLAEVSRVHPGLRSVYPGIPEPPPAPAESVRLRVAEGVLQMLDAVADGGPLAIVFDDLQFMDPATRDVLHVLARRLEGHGVLLVATSRVRSLEGGLLAGPLGDEPLAWHQTLHLGPLDPTDMRTLLTTLVPSLETEACEVLARILELAEGNPHFAEMLVADWKQYAADSLAAGVTTHELPADWSPPDSMRQAFANLYKGLLLTSQNVLQLLAAARRALTAAELSRCLRIEIEELDLHALALLDRGLLGLDHGALRFKSELHRAFVYFATSAERKKYYHSMLARGPVGPLKPGHFRERLEQGYHFLRAGNREEAGRLIRVAAKVAVSAGAPTEAEEALVDLLSAAQGESGVDAILTLAWAQSAQGKDRETLRTLEGLDLRLVSPREATHASLLQVRSMAALREESSHTVRAMADSVLAAAIRDGSEVLMAEALQLAAEMASEAGDLRRLQEIEHVIAEVRKRIVESHPKAMISLAVGYSLLISGQFQEAAEAFEEGIRLTTREDIVNLPLLHRLLNGLGMAHTSAGRLDDAEAAFARIVSTTPEQQRTAKPLLWCNVAVLQQDRGRFLQAAGSFATALEAAARHQSPRTKSTVFAAAASFCLDTGRFQQADDFLRLAEHWAARSAFRQDSLDVFLVRADYHLANQETELAWRLVEEQVLPKGERVATTGEAGRHERLLRHYVAETRGWEAYVSTREQREERVDRLPIAAQLEVRGLDAWLRMRRGDEQSGIEVVKEIVEATLPGILLHLAVIGTAPQAELASADGIANLKRAAQLFASAIPEPIPDRLWWPQLGS
jgi:DNA-binding SARP family transcriptional activator/tetratricopeptide (TPR) repeat protein